MNAGCLQLPRLLVFVRAGGKRGRDTERQRRREREKEKGTDRGMKQSNFEDVKMTVISKLMAFLLTFAPNKDGIALSRDGKRALPSHSAHTQSFMQKTTGGL